VSIFFSFSKIKIKDITRNENWPNPNEFGLQWDQEVQIANIY